MGIGMIVGGALKGYGDGMAEMARSREEERRETALINIRSQRQQEQTQVTADLQDRNSSRQAVYDNWVGAESDSRKAGIQEQTDNRRHNQGLTLAKIQFENEKALALFRSQRNITEAQEASALRISEEAKKANTYIDRYDIDDQGELVGITVTGKTFRLGLRPMPKPVAGAKGGTLLPNPSGENSSPTPPKKVENTGSAPKPTVSNW